MRFFVNIDHVATVREARKTDEPDPVRAAEIVARAGGDGITIHLREDRRHIQDRDVRKLAETIGLPLNFELAAIDEIVEIALDVDPAQATLVPEKRTEVTTEGGLALTVEEVRAGTAAAAARLRQAGIRTALFVDPVPAVLDLSAEMGVEAVELHTGEYANAATEEARHHEVQRLIAAANSRPAVMLVFAMLVRRSSAWRKRSVWSATGEGGAIAWAWELNATIPTQSFG